MNRPKPTPPTTAARGRTCGPRKAKVEIRAANSNNPPHSTCATCKDELPTCGYPVAASNARVNNTVATAQTNSVVKCWCRSKVRAGQRKLKPAPNGNRRREDSRLPAPLGWHSTPPPAIVVETDRGKRLGKRAGTLAGHDRGSDREEFDHVRAPAVRAFLQLHADDALGLELLALFLHPFHRKLSCVVEGLREVRHLDVLARLLHRREHSLVRNVVDAGAHHEPAGAVP